MNISKRTYRQLKNISSKCTFDTENKIAYVPLHYDTPDDLLDPHLSWPDKPVISDEAIDYIRDVMSCIPDAFSVEVSLTIDDYGIYTHSQLLDALRVTIENTYYYHDEKRRSQNVLGVFFLAIGFLALTVEVLGSVAGWFGPNNSVVNNIVVTLIDVMVWVFLWEGCALLLLNYEDESTIFSTEMQRFHKISFKNDEGKILISMDKQQFYEGWVHVGKKEAFARGYILFSNAIFLAALILQVVQFFASVHILVPVDLILYVINWIIILLLVCSNISFYLDKGNLKNYAVMLSAAVFIYNVLNALLYTTHLLTSTSYFIFNCVFILGLLVNIICLTYMKKQMVEV